MTPVTRDNVEELLDQGKLYAAITNGRWYRVRRNGHTKRWKRDASRIYIPFKIGLKEYGAITERHFTVGHGLCLDNQLFRHVDDVPKELRP